MKLLINSLKCKFSNFIPSSEQLQEDPNFPQRELAAFVASKVFYHLEAYDDSMRLALEAGELFNLDDRNEFVETLVSKCIDDYIKKRQRAHDLKDGTQVEPKLEAVVQRMYDRCYKDREYNHAIGIAIESRNLDKMEESIVKSGNAEGKLQYTYKVA